MVARTAGPEWSGPVRGPDFFGPIFFGPVRGPDFSVRNFLVRSVVRIFRSGFLWSGPCPDFWTEVIEIKWSGPDFVILKKNPDHGPDHKKIRTGTDYPDQIIRTTYRTSENPDQEIRTTDRTKKIRTEKSGPRTGPRKSGPKNPDQLIYPDRSGFSVRSGQPWL